MNIYLSLLLLCFIHFTQAKINMFLGTGGFGYGCGSNSPAIQLPYSYLRLGPDTTPKNKKLYASFQHFGGYSDADHAVRAFSHMHLVGAGEIDMGVFGVLPMTGNMQKLPKIPDNFLMNFNKEKEFAQPGYYYTELSHNIKVQLTTTQRCGYHRYSSVNSKPLDFYFMSSYLLQSKAKRYAHTSECGKNCLEGKIWSAGSFGGRFGGYNVYFHMEWKSNDENQKLFFYNSSGISQQQNMSEGNFSGAILRTKSNIIELKVGISYVSIENAYQNLQKEIGDKSFDEIKDEAKSIWKNELERFNFVAINEDFQTKIDTAIYRTLLTPTLFNDWNGEYPSFKNDGSISQVPSNMNNIYTDMSLWDVHRSQMPWILLHDPHRFNDIAMSIVMINREGQYMPKWPFANGPTGCMIGAHGNTVLSDWMIKLGYKRDDIDKQQVLGYMLRNANERTEHDSRSNPDIYKSLGYESIELAGLKSCSQTLQYSYNDFGISQVASKLGEQEVEKDFLNRSKFYKNVWNPKTKFFDPKYKNGTFKDISKKERINIFSNNYVEGDAWHYRFYAPHDAEGLIQLFGGKKQFAKQLEILFKRSTLWPILWLPNPYYWAGNEHDLFSVWMFPFADREDLTQKYSRMIIQKFYSVQGNGLPGNDDYGTMSAWLIFASMGFYPLPSTSKYILGSPLIHYGGISRKISESETRKLKIRVSNNSIKNTYVENVKVNGQKIYKFIEYSTIEQDTYIEFSMKK